MNSEEKSFQKRVVFENQFFIAFIPFFTDFPFGVFVVSKNHKRNFTEFSDLEKLDLAQLMKALTGGFDHIFNRPFPYVMSVHQTPVNSPEFSGCDEYYHFHIEFYPPLRDENKIKWYAGSEMGAWAAANPLNVDDCAEQLRIAIQKFLKK